MNRILVGCMLAAAHVVASGCAPAIHAQGASPRPDEQECRVLANRLGADPHSEAYRTALTSGLLASCGRVGATAIARTLERYSTSGDSITLNGLRFNAGHVRDPAILDAAQTVVESGSARLPYRILALEILLRQVDVESAFRGSITALETAHVGQFCVIDYVGRDAYRSEQAMPPDLVGRIARVTAAVAESASNPQVLRDLAACVHRAVADAS